LAFIEFQFLDEHKLSLRFRSNMEGERWLMPSAIAKLRSRANKPLPPEQAPGHDKNFEPNASSLRTNPMAVHISLLGLQPGFMVFFACSDQPGFQSEDED
jgi:hypothetical protein